MTTGAFPRLPLRSLLLGLAIVALAVFFSAAFTPIPGLDTPTGKARVTSHVITFTTLLLAVRLADLAVDRGAPRLPAYVIAVFGGALVGALVVWPLREALGVPFGFQDRALPGEIAQFAVFHRIDQFLLGTLIGGLATFVHVNRRTALAARRRQHEAERARALAQRRTLESQLQALQARVEPMFLFDTLDRIRSLYRTDATAAGRMLEDLIVYLRAALPHLRESTSTVDKEVTLVRSWLDIVGRAAGGWHGEFAIDDGVGEARVPALVLLPLVQCAVGGADRGGLRLRVAARASVDRLVIDVETSLPIFVKGIAAQPVLAQIDERLRALHGAAASFETRSAADGVGSVARVALPLESTTATAEAPGALP